MVAQNTKSKRRVLLGFVSIASVAALVGSMFALSGDHQHVNDVVPLASQGVANTSSVFDVAQSVAYKDGEKYISTDSFIKQHVDSAKTGTAKLKQRDAMTVTLTRLAQDATSLDEVWANGGEDFAGQYRTSIALYDGGGDYLVGRASSGELDASLLDWMAGYDNNDGQLVSDVEYDADNGLVYVPKSYAHATDDDKAGDKARDEGLRLQLVYNVADVNNAKTDIDLNIDESDWGDTVASDGVVTMAALAPSTRISMTPDTAYNPGFNDGAIKSVVVNGIEWPADIGLWSFNPSEAVLTLDAPAVSIHDVDVVMYPKSIGAVSNASISVIDTLDTLFGVEKAHADSFSSNDGYLRKNGEPIQFDFGGRPANGKTADLNARLWYSSGIGEFGDHGAGAAAPMVPQGVSIETLATTILNGGGVDASKLNVVTSNNGPVGNLSNNNYAVLHRDTETVGGVKIPPFSAALQCAHISIGTDLALGGTELTDTTDGSGNNAKIRMRVFQTNDQYALIGLVSPSSHTQAGAGIFWVKWGEEKGRINLVKHSAKPAYSDKNNAYSMEDIEYKVYSDEACTKEVTTLTLDAAGRSQTVDIKAGNYWVKETKTNDGYELNKTVYKVTVAPGQTATVQ